MSHSFKGISNQIVVRSRIIHPYVYWDGFFSDEELDKMEKIFSEKPLDQAMISGEVESPTPTPKVGLIDRSVRSSRMSFHNPNEKNNWIFNKFNIVIDDLNSKFYNFDLNGYDDIQYSEYHASEQGKYHWHMDTYLGELPAQDVGTRKLSLSLLLNDPDKDFKGGNFEMLRSTVDEPDVIPFKRGRLILFPSFMFHRVTEVTEGVRKSVVIWVQGPKFR
jgi:PKHD-type hydroxylase